MALPLGLGDLLRRAGRPENEATAANARASDYFLNERQAKAVQTFCGSRASPASSGASSMV
ncbi:MAG: hypothetical protein U0271_10360 [Polyangiaceae bacterium]